jgi:hypothetical protein
MTRGPNPGRRDRAEPLASPTRIRAAFERARERGRELVMDRLRQVDLGAILIGLLILGVGVYYLLANTFGITLPDLNWDKIWPLAILALGIGILWGAWAKMGHGGHGPQGA